MNLCAKFQLTVMTKSVSTRVSKIAKKKRNIQIHKYVYELKGMTSAKISLNYTTTDVELLLPKFKRREAPNGQNHTVSAVINKYNLNDHDLYFKFTLSFC